MKKILLTLFFIATITYASQAQTRIGAGLGWGSEIEELGIGINGEFFLKDNISLNPGFIFFLVDDGPFDKRNFWTFNINGNFYFHETSSVSVYGIGGLNLSTMSVEDNDFDLDDSSTELGINLGIGSNFDVGGAVLPYAEMKYVLGDFDQLVIFFGVKFGIN